MKAWIRQWLGIEKNIEELKLDLFYVRKEIQKDYRVTQQALGRIVAKLDPDYNKPESDPARKAESERLGEEVIKRLEAEDWARKHTTGEA